MLKPIIQKLIVILSVLSFNCITGQVSYSLDDIEYYSSQDTFAVSEFYKHPENSEITFRETDFQSNRHSGVIVTA